MARLPRRLCRNVFYSRSIESDSTAQAVMSHTQFSEAATRFRHDCSHAELLIHEFLTDVERSAISSSASSGSIAMRRLRAPAKRTSGRPTTSKSRMQLRKFSVADAHRESVTSNSVISLSLFATMAPFEARGQFVGSNHHCHSSNILDGLQ